jgi:putative membrane protein
MPPKPNGSAISWSISEETMASEPPPIPTPWPIAPQEPPSWTESLILEGRLHPLTLFFAIWEAVRRVLIPFIIIFLLRRERGQEVYVLMAFFFVGLPTAFAVIKYFTFTYRITRGELITKHGILGRTQRHIPLNRVQDIRVEQRPLHRIFRVAEVHIETAGGKGPEASLSVLSRAEADRLRAAVFEQIARAKGVDTEVRSLPAEVICKLSVPDLMLAGITSNQTASTLAILVVAWGLVDDFVGQEAYQRWIERTAQNAAEWVEHAGQSGWIVFGVGALLLIVAGVLFSMVGSVLMFYGFTLSRNGEDLHRSYGLLTRRSSSLPRRRIQVLKIEETILRRLFKLATIRADTAGSRNPQGEQDSGGRDVLVPIVLRRKIAELLPVFFPDLENGSEDWRKVSRRAIRRGTVKGAALCAFVAAILFTVQDKWLALWPLAFLPLVYFVNVLNYRHLGYLHGERYFRTRRGWLRRSTHIVPIRNLQVVVLRQTPFDRRHKVASVMVDTAGQAYTGGSPKVGNVPAEEALALARSLARQAAGTRFKL